MSRSPKTTDITADEFDIQQQTELFSQSVELDIQTRASVVSAYRKTWSEFYSWKQDYCTQAISSLAAVSFSRPHASLLRSQDVVVPATDLELPYWDAIPGLDAGSPDSYFEPDSGFAVVDFDEERGYALDCSSKSIPFLHPHPKYESCSPSNRNVASKSAVEYPLMSHASSESSLLLPFIKYDGEPQFPTREYVKGFNIFLWQADWRDPDCKFIYIRCCCGLINNLSPASLIIAAVISQLTSNLRMNNTLIPQTYISNPDLLLQEIDNQRIFPLDVKEHLFNSKQRYIYIFLIIAKLILNCLHQRSDIRILEYLSWIPRHFYFFSGAQFS